LPVLSGAAGCQAIIEAAEELIAMFQEEMSRKLLFQIILPNKKKNWNVFIKVWKFGELREKMAKKEMLRGFL